MKKLNLKNERLAYVKILFNDFQFRREKTAFYSLRDYAKELNFDPIHLSRVFKNQKGISRRKAESIVRKLRLSIEEQKNFILLVSAASGRSGLERNLANMGLRNRKKRLVSRQ